MKGYENLPNLIEQIWIEKVFQDVVKDRIWMEADLVASFYMNLRNWYDDKGYYILLEQKPGGPFYYKGIQNVGPIDLTMRNSLKNPEDIIAVFEFKHINCQNITTHSKRKEVVEDFRKLNEWYKSRR